MPGFPGAAFVLDFDPEHAGAQARVDGEGPSRSARVAVQHRIGGELGQARERVADNLPGIVAVRDSKDRTGAVLVLTSAQWAEFIAGIRAGEPSAD